MVLLEKQSATCRQVLLRCLALLQTSPGAPAEDGLPRPRQCPAPGHQCSAMILPLRMEELNISCDTSLLRTWKFIVSLGTVWGGR